NNGGVVLVTNSAQIFAFGNGGPSSYGSGYLNLNSGGLLVSGRNIIKNQANAKGYVTFNGGTLKVATNSATFMQGLTSATISTNGATIDDGGNTVTIAQPLLHDPTLTTDGGLVKQGAGILTLAGLNTYNGNTTINGGTLGINSGASAAPGAYGVSSGATLAVRSTVPGDTMNIAALTLNNGAALTINETNLSTTAIAVSGALTIASPVTVNLTNMTLAIGQYPLVSYGTLAGAGVSGLALGATPTSSGLALSLVNNSANHTIDLLVAPATVVLTWDGTINGNWDIGGTANWKTGAFYTQTAGVGPIVTLDDSAAGTTSLTLATTVAPTTLVVNNSARDYNLSGAGQIAGSGGLSKQGSGTLVLATVNTFTNQTALTGGTLQLGDGATSNGSVGGAIVDNAALVVANPLSQTMNNLISGSGSFTKNAAGILTLTASNSLSGVVTVNGGTLNLNQGGAGGTGPVLGAVSSLSIGTGAALSLAGANALGFSNSVVLPALNLAGGATLNLIGTGGHAVSSVNLGDASNGGMMTGAGGLIVNGNFTNHSASTVALTGGLNCNSTNIFLTSASALVISNDFNLFAPGAG
ncbi:MAG TPA: autotransporter-associated beta strand repeat-containing protein, partial [Verrucomicrobiae bacterium]